MSLHELIESVLDPSKVVRPEFQTVTVQTDDGLTSQYLLVTETENSLTVRDPADGRELKLPLDALDDWKIDQVSVMPEGLANLLRNRDEFVDLAHYVQSIVEGGRKKARLLRPPGADSPPPPLPEYESRLDHAKLISGWNDQSLERGEKIYTQHCANCHGTHEKEGSLPTSLRFASGRFKNGHDPLQMYKTLTNGYGMMVAQRWMVPQQKYDVIHYIRERYLKPHNSSQYSQVDNRFLASLPAGDTIGPRAVDRRPWAEMNYGRRMNNTFEVGKDAKNFSYKGIVIRLDEGPGGVSRGKYWSLFDHDTMRVSAAWSGERFIDWRGIHFNGEHNAHPRIDGTVYFQNPAGPGWARPGTLDLTDERLVGRDGVRYGPLDRSWAKFLGTYRYGDRTVFSYRVGSTKVLETPSLTFSQSLPVFARSFEIAPHDERLTLRVCRQPGAEAEVSPRTNGEPFIVLNSGDESPERSSRRSALNGDSFWQFEDAAAFDMHERDFTISARFKTEDGGTIFAKTADEPSWVRDGKSLFVRGGRIVFDIGWVGAVVSRRRVDDGQWHNVSLTWSAADGSTRIFIDGQLDQEGRLKPRRARPGYIARIGFTADDFPERQSFFVGQISDVRFFQRRLNNREIRSLTKPAAGDKLEGLVGRWRPDESKGAELVDGAGNGRDAMLIRGSGESRSPQQLWCGHSLENADANWRTTADGDLLLEIPPSKQPQRFHLLIAEPRDEQSISGLQQHLDEYGTGMDLRALTSGGSPQWPETVTTEIVASESDEAFAVDVLSRPVDNPWAARTRFTGIDFFSDRDRAAVCSWTAMSGWSMEFSPAREP